ncbi:hypothetical protein RRG08_029962 [Elysia crispata]|uniref:Uncharacterized protein n=1 Tax=Elysia crispata TaxID=231223 RepID=A0AAE0ZKV6_9GAST|nr:hypothetical protein RRG08_029962 [Elysia crispata]
MALLFSPSRLARVGQVRARQFPKSVSTRDSPPVAHYTLINPVAGTLCSLTRSLSHSSRGDWHSEVAHFSRALVMSVMLVLIIQHDSHAGFPESVTGL